MKRFYGFFVGIIFITCLTTNIYAEEDTTCNYSSKASLQQSAYSVEFSPTIKKDESGNYYYELSIYNITDDIYASITNDINEEELIINNAVTTNNNYSFSVYDNEDIIEYEIHIRPMKYGCTDELRKISYTKPRYNSLSEIEMCKRDELADYSYCQTWVTKYFKETREEAIAKINEQYNKKTTTTTTKCISCVQIKKTSDKVNKKQTMRIAIIIGLSVAIMLDIAIIVLLIIRLKRYDI